MKDIANQGLCIINPLALWVLIVNNTYLLDGNNLLSNAHLIHCWQKKTRFHISHWFEIHVSNQKDLIMGSNCFAKQKWGEIIFKMQLVKKACSAFP